MRTVRLSTKQVGKAACLLGVLGWSLGVSAPSLAQTQDQDPSGQSEPSPDVQGRDPRGDKKPRPAAVDGDGVDRLQQPEFEDQVETGKQVQELNVPVRGGAKERKWGEEAGQKRLSPVLPALELELLPQAPPVRGRVGAMDMALFEAERGHGGGDLSRRDVEEMMDRMSEETFLQSPHVVESAARHRQPIGLSPSAITVLTREDIATFGGAPDGLADLFRLVPGMDVITSSTSAATALSRCDWNWQCNYYRILVDGREVNDQVIGSTFLNQLPLSMEDIERIEILRGPGSPLYGSSAVAGVVSISTRSIPGRAATWAQLSGGEAGGLSANARHSLHRGPWGLSLGGQMSAIRSFAAPSGPARLSHFLRGLLEYSAPGEGRLQAEATWSYNRYALSSGVGGTFSGRAEQGSLRLGYESKPLVARLYWIHGLTHQENTTPLSYGDFYLGKFHPFSYRPDILDVEGQWNLPRFWEPLVLIAGGVTRSMWLRGDDMLDAATFADPQSDRFHQLGLSVFEWGLGAFVHAELAPFDWVTVTGGARLDYNNTTKTFVSPRLALVVQPLARQYLRVGVARAFRRPTPTETRGHFAVDFPADSVLDPGTQEEIQEMMTRVFGNQGLENEVLLSVDAGYLGHFLDRRLTIALDLYHNRYSRVIDFQADLREVAPGWPDLASSSYYFVNTTRDSIFVGSELSVRYTPRPTLSLLGSLTYRQGFDADPWRARDTSPKVVMAAGGRFRARSGLLGSLYLSARSDFWERAVENPEGILSGARASYRESFLVVTGRLGWEGRALDLMQFETGLKLFLPVSPAVEPHFRYREQAGGLTPGGQPYGGEELSRIVTAYLQGTF